MQLSLGPKDLLDKELMKKLPQQSLDTRNQIIRIHTRHFICLFIYVGEMQVSLLIFAKRTFH